MKRFLMLAVLVGVLTSFCARDSYAYPCHGLGDAGACLHRVHAYDYYGNTYPCGHAVHQYDLYPCVHVCY